MIALLLIILLALVAPGVLILAFWICGLLGLIIALFLGVGTLAGAAWGSPTDLSAALWLFVILVTLGLRRRLWGEIRAWHGSWRVWRRDRG